MDIMNEALPISINVSDALAAEIKNILSISNKLSAQLNFHTMTANWYGEEENVLSINFYLVSFVELNNLAKNIDKADVDKLADDVLLSSIQRVLDCHVAITDTELVLIEKQPKLLSGYLAKKLTKVLNLIADRQGFVHI
ncbi:MULTISPECIES: hypothetical protein [unclassified Colwellia]|jgi:hypothetical protein|uniref:hypothetical protein n=1 Tax=unclassified Colwellia TaxID=196834 RepID=UPI000D393A6C|nr:MULTISPECIES: hypothetical protein [unclassified Colwellia]AWB56194.1 hypothetical protein DBO93_00485 [Colwellia sp. Arc7-D]MBA6415789.1 hypothetical protein [Colwellia sp. 6M3]